MIVLYVTFSNHWYNTEAYSYDSYNPFLQYFNIKNTQSS